MPKQSRSTAPTGRPFAGFLVFDLAALTVLSACAGKQGVVYNRNFTSAYSAASLAAMRQPLPVETFGSPGPAVSQDRVTAATIQGLRNHGPRWAQLTYTANPDDPPNAPYYLRIVYGASTAFARSRLCQAGLSQSDVAFDPESSRTIAAVCRNGRYISQAEGSPGIDVDITSEAFSKFVGLIGRQVLPRRNPEATLPRRND